LIVGVFLRIKVEQQRVNLDQGSGAGVTQGTIAILWLYLGKSRVKEAGTEVLAIHWMVEDLGKGDRGHTPA